MQICFANGGKTSEFEFKFNSDGSPHYDKGIKKYKLTMNDIPDSCYFNTQATLLYQDEIDMDKHVDLNYYLYIIGKQPYIDITSGDGNKAKTFELELSKTELKGLKNILEKL